MSVNRTSDAASREQLGFLEQARVHFGFLVEQGFEEVRAAPTYVRFDRSDLFVEVYHGRRSYELGVELGRTVRRDGHVIEEKYGLPDVQPVLVPEVTYAVRAATSRPLVAQFVEELADVVRIALPALEHDVESSFDRVRSGADRRSREYVDRGRAAELRARADSAWRRDDFGAVVAAYREIDAELTTVELRESERKRLDYALGRV